MTCGVPAKSRSAGICESCFGKLGVTDSNLEGTTMDKFRKIRHCVDCGVQISQGRLDAEPRTERCVLCQEMADADGLTPIRREEDVVDGMDPDDLIRIVSRTSQGER